ncbi:MAG: hypothetical protein JSS98_19950 [Bacteroidetes bacterium]|nr:hypothetical protein [Bacteroidota bacterium]
MLSLRANGKALFSVGVLFAKQSFAALEIASFLAMTVTGGNDEDKGRSWVASNHPGIVFASKWEGTVQCRYFICEAIFCSVRDCFVPRNDGDRGQ